MGNNSYSEVFFYKQRVGNLTKTYYFPKNYENLHGIVQL